MSIFDNMRKAAGNKYANKVSDGNIADVDSYVDTGSYSLNALCSGSIFGGIPSNKTTVLAGESATGKTFYAMNIVREFLKANKGGHVFYFDSESAVTTEMVTSRGINPLDMTIVPVLTIQEFRTQAVRMLDLYTADAEANPEKKKPLLMVLDSLGALSTTKEITDISEGSEAKDMTKAGLVRGMFRVLDLKLGVAKVAMVVTNHTYAQVGAYVPTRVQSGGEGTAYGADNVIFLKKSKDKDKETKEVRGVVITCTNNKSRLTIENKAVETYLDYHLGLDKYYGLIDIALKHDVFVKDGNKLSLPGGVKVFESKLVEEPVKYFTQEVLLAIDAAARKEFTYGAMEKTG